MPIYEYRCEDCHQLFEEWCKHVEPSSSARTCPICGGRSPRIMSQTSFALKGDGWYATEYGSLRNKAGEEKQVGSKPEPAEKNASGQNGTGNGADNGSGAKNSADNASGTNGGGAKPSKGTVAQPADLAAPAQSKDGSSTGSSAAL